MADNALCKALREVAQSLQDQYGVMVLSVRFEWTETTHIDGERSALVDSLRVEMSSK